MIESVYVREGSRLIRRRASRDLTVTLDRVRCAWEARTEDRRGSGDTREAAMLDLFNAMETDNVGVLV